MKRIISVLVIAMMLCGLMSVNAFAATYVDFGFDDEGSSLQYCMLGDFEAIPDGMNDSNGGVLSGYSSARALQTIYDDKENDGYFSDTAYTWLQYDARIKVAVGIDNPDSTSRSITLSYCNDNLKWNGLADSRQYINFVLDFTNQQVYVTSGGNGSTNPEERISDVKSYELLGDDCTTWYEVGISVSTNRFRCFINDALIFDIADPQYYIATTLESPILLWNNECWVLVDHMTVTDVGDLYPMNAPAPVDSSNVDSSNNDTGDVNPNPPVSGDNSDPNNNNNNVGGDVNNNNGGDVGGNVGGDVGGNAGNNAGGNAGNNAGGNAGNNAGGNAGNNAGGNAGNNASGNAGGNAGLPANTASTNANGQPVNNGSATATGDASFIVIAVMVVALGTALIVKKVTVK